MNRLAKQKTALNAFVHFPSRETTDITSFKAQYTRSNNKEDSLTRMSDVRKNNKMISHLIVPNLDTRKFIDLKRWYCIPRPLNSKAGGITSIVGCWNYLFSILGNGTLPILTPESALKLIQDTNEFSSVNDNKILFGWFESLCKHFNVKCKISMFIKEDEKVSNTALRNYIEDIRNERKAFVCHRNDRFIVPIGYDIVPNDPVKGYTDEIDLNVFETWVLVGETSKKEPGMRIVKWKDIMKQHTYCHDYKEKLKAAKLKKDKQKTKEISSFIVFEAV